MEKSKKYYNVRFNPEVLEEVHKKFIEIVNKYTKGEIEHKVPQVLEISIKDERWNFDHLEEFLSMINEAADYCLDHMINDFRIRIVYTDYSSLKYCEDRVSVRFSHRFDIEAIFNIFENYVKKYSTKEGVEKKNFKIFIGHGEDEQWRNLKDHLTEKHGFEIICYEIGPKAGTTIKEVLESMLNNCSFALLVFTGEDIDIKGMPHARENVIHELGLFQGRLGFNKAIILLEENVKEFSNIVGLNQLRFKKGNIKEIFGDIVATLNKEFIS